MLKLLGFRALRLEIRETGFLSTFTAQSVRIFLSQVNSVFLGEGSLSVVTHAQSASVTNTLPDLVYFK